MKDTYRVRFSPAAMEDLQNIYLYIASELMAPVAAENQVNRIRSGIRSLDTFPSRHVLVDWEPWASAGVHKLPIDNYVVYYQVAEEEHTVMIVRIFYGGRNVKAIAEELDP